MLTVAGTPFTVDISEEFPTGRLVEAGARGIVTETFLVDTDKYISVTATDSAGNTSEFSMVDTDGDALADAWELGDLIDILRILNINKNKTEKNKSYSDYKEADILKTKSKLFIL